MSKKRFPRQKDDSLAPTAQKRKQQDEGVEGLMMKVTASDFFTDACPPALLMVMGLLSHTHRETVQEAQKSVSTMYLRDVVVSVEALEAAARVAPSLGLPWPPPQDVCKEAIRVGHADVLARAAALGCPLDVPVLWTYALEHGPVTCLTWLRDHHGHQCALNHWTCSRAAHEGQLGVLQWLRAQGCPWDGYTCTCAAFKGHLGVLQWARAQGCPWDGQTCSGAASCGHLAMLQWLRAQGCPWNKYTSWSAAMNGHLGVLQWARAQDPPCPWDKGTCADAANHGHWALLKWLRTQDPPCPWYRDTEAKAKEHLGEAEVASWG